MDLSYACHCAARARAWSHHWLALTFITGRLGVNDMAECGHRHLARPLLSPAKRYSIGHYPRQLPDAAIEAFLQRGAARRRGEGLLRVGPPTTPTTSFT
jgi:hypothetical protein